MDWSRSIGVACQRIQVEAESWALLEEPSNCGLVLLHVSLLGPLDFVSVGLVSLSYKPQPGPGESLQTVSSLLHIVLCLFNCSAGFNFPIISFLVSRYLLSFFILHHHFPVFGFRNLESLSVCPSYCFVYFYFIFLMVTILSGIKWNLCVVLVCISLTARDVGHFYVIVVHLHFFLKRCIFICLAVF